MNISSVETWLIIGVFFIAIEFSTIPGIGFLFLGFGALTVSWLLYLYPALVNYQLATLGITSFAWFLALWWPLKVFLYKGKSKANSNHDSFNLIGNQVVVIDTPIKPDVIGQVTWSGTTMNAKLATSEKSQIEVGDTLYILDVKGNVLICTTKMRNHHEQSL